MSATSASIDTSIYPWKLDPQLTPAVWGGDELVTKYGKPGSPRAKLGESWECWDENTVANGSLCGTSLSQLRTNLKNKFLGDLECSSIFPVLTKIITADDWLSVQVHPDDYYAQCHEHAPHGKTECWYVIAAVPHAEIVLGWTRETSREEYQRRVADGSLGEILRKVSVKAGDTVYIPAGTVHAIGPGIVVFETQQAGDLTYRMFDWNRVGLDGKPRDLHIQKAADVLNYRAADQATLLQIAYRHEDIEHKALIADPRFSVEYIVAPETSITLETLARPLIVTALEYALELACNGVTVALEPYETALIPAASGSCSVRSKERIAPFLFVTPPDSPNQLAIRLCESGIAQEQILAFMKQFAARAHAAPVTQS